MVRDPSKSVPGLVLGAAVEEGVSVGEPGSGGNGQRKAPIPQPSLTCSSRQCLCFSEIWLFRACFSFSRFSRDSVDQSSFSSSPCLELWGGVLGSESGGQPHPVCTAGGGWEGSGGAAPTQGCLQWRWGGGPWYTAGARKNRESAAQPQARTLEAQSRAASGSRAEKMGPWEGHPAGASEGHPGEETGRFQQARPSTQGMWAQGPWAVGGGRAEGALAVKIRAESEIARCP